MPRLFRAARYLGLSPPPAGRPGCRLDGRVRPARAQTVERLGRRRIAPARLGTSGGPPRLPDLELHVAEVDPRVRVAGAGSTPAGPRPRPPAADPLRPSRTRNSTAYGDPARRPGPPRRAHGEPSAASAPTRQRHVLRAGRTPPPTRGQRKARAKLRRPCRPTQPVTPASRACTIASSRRLRRSVRIRARPPRRRVPAVPRPNSELARGGRRQAGSPGVSRARASAAVPDPTNATPNSVQTPEDRILRASRRNAGSASLPLNKTAPLRPR